MLYNVTLYYNTGFDRGNVPDSPARLAAYTSRDFDAVNIRQDYATAYVRIKATWPDVRDADFCRLQPDDGTAATYYIIPNAAIQVNNNVAHIPLVLEPLTSLGGIAALSVLSGWTNRAHASDDTLFSNTLPEQFAPSQPMTIRNYTVIHTEKETDASGNPKPNLRIALATCDISRGEYAEARVVKASRDASADSPTAENPDFLYMLLPSPGQDATTPLDFTTTLKIGAYRGPGETEQYEYTLPNIYAFDLSNKQVIDGINAIRSIGIESAILAMYSLPVEDASFQYLAEYPHEGEHPTVGLITELYGQSKTYTPSQPFLYYNFKNKKGAALFQFYQITSITSGDTNSFSAQDLYMDGAESPTYVTQTDPSPSGTVYCSPTHFEGAPTHRLEQAVAGLPWLNAGFTYTQASGGELAMANARRANTIVDLNRDLNVQGIKQNRNQQRWHGGLNIAGSIGGAIYKGTIGAAKAVASGGAALTGLTEGLEDLYEIPGQIVDLVYNDKHANRNIEQANANADFQMGDNLFGAAVAANVSAPSLAFPISVNAAAYYGNGFAIMQVTLRDSDAQRFDDFLSAYGYAQDKPLEISDLNNRTNHNYIKTSGAELQVQGAPRWLLSLLANMLDAGVRIWHTTPSKDALLNNPIKAGDN